MKRLEQLFAENKKKILNVYCTAGYPQLESTMTVMKSLQEYGADLIEIGMPYSDPLADGPVIQLSGSKALANGMTISKLFSQLKNLRNEIHIPVLLMGYMNPVLQFGFDRFCSHASSCGIDGLIIPDLPMYEFEKEYGVVIKNYGLDFIFLITPETSEQRVRKIDSLSSGFVYAVSSSSLTGSDKNFSEVENYLKNLNEMGLKNPILTGFGIRDKESFTLASKHTRGAIIGSAYIKMLENENNIKSGTKKFLEQILN